MKSVLTKVPARLAFALMALLYAGPGVEAQAPPQEAPTPMDEKARQRAEREARKAAEQEEKELRAAVEKERKAAEASARERDKEAARLAESERRNAGPSADQAPQGEALTREQQRLQRAEEKARAEAEKARQKEEERARAQEAKDAERRRKDEERAQREAVKAREQEDKARAAALKREQEEAERGARSDRANTPADPLVYAPPAAGETLPPLSKDEEKRRRELVKQIEKARTERDRLNQKAEEAEMIARTARAAATEGQRSYEALATGLAVEDVTVPVPQAPAAEDTSQRSRFTTMAAARQAAAPKEAVNAPDPLRIALELKNPDAAARERAAFTLATLGPDAHPATRALMAAMTDPNPAVRVAAAQALGRIGPAALAAVAPLSAALTDPDPAVKNAAQAALLSIRSR